MPSARDFLTLGRDWFTWNEPPCKLGEPYLSRGERMFRPWSPVPNADRTAETTMQSAGAGQPRPWETDARQPTAAERVRTLVESNASATLGIPGVELDDADAATPAARTVTPDGDVLLLMPGDSPAA